MTLREYSGNAQRTSLNGGISASDTTIAVASGIGYPTGSTAPFVITIEAGTTAEERVLIASRSGNNLTVAASGRGWDGTTASTHANTATVDHTFSATDARDANAHINDTTLDHHTQYAWVKKGLAALRGAAGRSMKLHYGTDSGLLGLDDGTAWHDFQDKAAADAAYLSAAVAAATYLPLAGGTLSGELVLPDLKVTGLTGSVQPTRFVGGTVAGAPTTGAHLLGDFVIDQSGLTFICTVAGTPGTWAGSTGSAGAVTPIARTVLGSTATSISFTSIPGTYESLRVELSASGSAAFSLLMRFNSDSTANYDWQQSNANNSTVTAAQSFADTSITVGGISASGFACSVVVEIPGYSRSVLKKALLSRCARVDGASSGNFYLYTIGGLWRSTSAITQIDLTGGTFAVGTVATLYGIKGA